MSDLSMHIKCPELVEALNNLARALGGATTKGVAVGVTGFPIAAPVTQAPVTPFPVATTESETPAAPWFPQQVETAPAFVPPAVPMFTPPAPVAAPVTQAIPTAPAPTYTIEQLQTATGVLMDKGPQAMDKLQQLLQKYGVQRVPDLSPEQIGAFATDLRALGVSI